MTRLAIFDFDGTLVDTITDVALCFNRALDQCGFPKHPLLAFGDFVGGDLETVVSRMLPEGQKTEKNITRVKTVYRELYLHSEKPNTQPYPGIVLMLERLKAAGVRLAVHSNKGQALLEDTAEKLFPYGFFDAVVGYAEDRPSKPDPDGVRRILGCCGCGREDAVYVGDGHTDIATARNAGIPCILVTWGQGRGKDRADPAVWKCADTAEQLEQVLLSL